MAITMIKIYPKNENDKNETVEKIINGGLIITDKNKWGYMINANTVASVNNMGYKLWLVGGKIIYER